MREQRDGRCNVPVADDGHREINVKVAVLVATGGEILATIPADVVCPSVEAYTAETVRRISEGIAVAGPGPEPRSEEHTSELQSLMRSSYAVFCLKKKKKRPT